MTKDRKESQLPERMQEDGLGLRIIHQGDGEPLDMSPWTEEDEARYQAQLERAEGR